MTLFYLMLRGAAILLLIGMPASFVFGQMDFLAPHASVTLTDTRESHLSTYTLVGTGTADGGAGLPTDLSYVPAGSLGSLVFPEGSKTQSISSIVMDIGGTNYPLTWTVWVDNIVNFPMPVALARNQAFTLVVTDVRNPPIDPACGGASNTYFGAAPCDDFVMVALTNATGGTNYYHHYGSPMFTITAVPYYLEQVEVFQPSTHGVFPGATDEEIFVVNLEVAGSFGTLPSVEKFSFSTTGTSNPADILGTGLWFTDSVYYFHAPNEVLITQSGMPGSSFDLTTAFQLSHRENYFFLTYDVDCNSASVGNTLDAVLDSVRVAGVSYAGAGAPESRPIVADLTNFAGNLLPNPSFENFSSCPTSYSGITIGNNEMGKCIGWNHLSPPNTGGTSDYFHTCAFGTTAGVPVNNFSGYQQPRTGNAYVGVVSYSGQYSDYKEYIQCRLPAPLQADTIYAFSMWLSSGDSLNSRKIVKTDGFGMLASDTLVDPGNWDVLPQTPQILFDDIIYDQQDWVPLTGTFQAQGGEEYIVIGCFKGQTTIQVDGHGNPGGGYYLIDDVALTKLSNVTDTCPPVALPVTWQSFEGEAIEASIQLEWSIASAQNVSHFVIERSADQASWSDLGQVAFSGTEMPYGFADRQPLPGDNFYRLRQVDANGHFTHSRTVRVWWEPLELTVYPVPVRDEFKIRVPKAWAGATMRMHRVDGTLAGQFLLEEGEIVCGQGFGQGVYFLSCVKDGRVWRKRVVVVE